MDVGLTPYADTPFNQASFPLKTLEYLSAGLPVVSTDLPGALAAGRPGPQRTGGRRELIALASEETEFVAAVRRLAAGPGAADTAVPAEEGRTQAARATADGRKAGQAKAGSARAADGNAARAASARAFAARHTWERRAEVPAAAIASIRRGPRCTNMRQQVRHERKPPAGVTRPEPSIGSGQMVPQVPSIWSRVLRHPRGRNLVPVCHPPGPGSVCHPSGGRVKVPVYPHTMETADASSTPSKPAPSVTGAMTSA
jgi:hypothetical protein